MDVNKDILLSPHESYITMGEANNKLCIKVL